MIGPGLSLLVHPVIWYDSGAAPPFVGPLDSLPPTSVAYSMRRLLSAYVANKAIQVRRASDNATLDVGFLTNGDLDVPTLTTFLAATNGFITTFYDQSGGGLDLTQPTAANQPPMVLAEASMNSRPAASFVTASAHSLTRAATPNLAQPFTGAFVAERTALFTTFNAFACGDSTAAAFYFRNVANSWAPNCGVFMVGAAANDSVAHCLAGMISGAASKTATDQVISGTSNAGAVALTGFRLGLTNTGATPLSGRIGEAIVFPSFLSDPNIAALQVDQKAYWGTA